MNKVKEETIKSLKGESFELDFCLKEIKGDKLMRNSSKILKGSDGIWKK